MTTCTCDTFSASTNATVLTANNTSTTSTASQVIYAHSSTSGMPYVIFAEGATNGVLGKSYVANGIGIYGQAVYNVGSTGGIGVYGQVPSVGGTGVVGENTNGSGAGTGVRGIASGFGVYGTGSTGVYGSGTTGVYGSTTASGGYGLYSNGDAWVSGYLYKQGGGFIIDHPTDPENKFLNHCFVESPEMMNLYRGRGVFDAKGESVISLPTYFEAANENPEYILTALGASMPNMYVSQEIVNGKFKVSGGLTGNSFSWQVSAARSDKWAKANHPGVEINKKPEQRGLFINPELHGHDRSKNINAISREEK